MGVSVRASGGINGLRKSFSDDFSAGATDDWHFDGQQDFPGGQIWSGIGSGLVITGGASGVIGSWWFGWVTRFVAGGSQFAEAELVTVSAGTQTVGGPFVVSQNRINTAAFGGYVAAVAGTDRNVRIRWIKEVINSSADLAVSANGVVSNTDVVRIEVENTGAATVIEVFVNGSSELLVSSTDGFRNQCNGGGPGLHIGSNAVGIQNFRWTDFECGLV